MLGNVKRYSRIYLAYGYTDLRFGIDGLARVVQDHFSLDPFQKGCLFLFCGRRTDRIKGLLREGDGFVLVYKRLEAGRFQWPRTAQEAREITLEQFTWLMQGLAIEQKRRIPEVTPERICCGEALSLHPWKLPSSMENMSTPFRFTVWSRSSSATM